MMKIVFAGTPEIAARALIRFGYRQGPAVAKALRGVSVGTTARTINNSKRRGLRVVMDDPDAL